MDFSKLEQFIKDMRKDYAVPACDLAIYKDHKEIFRCMSGFSDDSGTKPVSKDDVYLLYSSSKLVTCVAALRLIEQGKMGLNDPVSKYIPEYADLKVKEGDTVRPTKTQMTIRHLMTMTGGVSYDRQAPNLLALKDNKEVGTLGFIKEFARNPLEFDPGDGYLYSMCHDILGAVIGVVSGSSLGEYVKKEIFDPLEMYNSSYLLREDQKPHLSQHFVLDENKNPVPNYDESEFYLCPNYESGGASIYCTVDDYIKFADAIACGGVGFNGYRVLSEEMVNEFGKDQLNDMQREIFVKNSGHLGHGYGYGVSVLLDREPRHFTAPNGIFGWGGMCGTRAFIDTKNKISLFYAQDVQGCVDTSYEDHQHNKIVNLLYEALGE